MSLKSSFSRVAAFPRAVAVSANLHIPFSHPSTRISMVFIQRSDRDSSLRPNGCSLAKNKSSPWALNRAACPGRTDEEYSLVMSHALSLQVNPAYPLGRGPIGWPLPYRSSKVMTISLLLIEGGVLMIFRCEVTGQRTESPR